MPQFVILRHTLPADSERASHFDLMLESGETLLTWAIAELPTKVPTAAEELPPHRRAYLDYEGPVSNNRGTVKRIDRGVYEWVRQSADELLARIEGEQLRGLLLIQRRHEQMWEVSLRGET
ncbi:DNA polymerase ligase N-terminal domain-containing protein [Anatilimnocola sp. NA78]|uniref:DNA polymerase ligase N-terminal domain-containing protein n=1 Tax=Anatilimnocola sp. NA78 TaxID=3415683 RepID=UPI003CE4A259